MVISCLPDTGCSQTIISSSIACQLRCKTEPNSAVHLFTADGNCMPVLGLPDLSITNNYNNNLVEIKTHVIVTANLAHPALISWHDMVRLNIIHDSFLVTALPTTSSFEDLRWSVISHNPNVFKDSITSTPCVVELSLFILHVTLSPSVC